MDNEIILAIVSTTLFILLLIAVILIVFFIFGRQRQEQHVKLAQAKTDFEKELRQVETEVSEQVMGRFAHELHDNIGQLLTATRIQVENQKLDHPELAEGFKPIEIYLGEVTQQLRILSRTMNHDYIGHLGLLGAVQLEADRLKDLKRFNVYWLPVSGSSNLDKNQELMVFRIFQEVIQNALRHSSADNLHISMDNRGDGFTLEVRDDGKGCDMEQVFRSDKASGLRNMMKRASLARMECHIKSSPGKGCIVRIQKVH